MGKTLRNTLIGVLFLAGLMVIASNAYASSVSYNTSSSVYLVGMVNDTSDSATIYANTRPSAGTGGAVVTIRKSDLTYVTSKLFPYYTSVSDLTASVPSGELRRIYIRPNTNGQTIQGDLYYGFY